MNCEMAFLIVFPSFTPKKRCISHRFQIISHLILILLLICFAHFSYMMAAAFPGLSPDLRLFLSLCCLLINFLLFTAFLCIIHLISYCFPLLIAISSCYYLYRCTRVNRSFHSSGRFFLLQCTGLSTGVERYRCRQKNMRMSALYTSNKR